VSRDRGGVGSAPAGVDVGTSIVGAVVASSASIVVVITACRGHGCEHCAEKTRPEVFAQRHLFLLEKSQ